MAATTCRPHAGYTSMTAITTVLLVLGAAPGLLITTEELAQARDVDIVDTRDVEAYAAGHIPGAVNVPSGELSATRNGVPGMLRPADALAPLLASHGLAPESPVVVYAGMFDASELKHATRVLWALEYLGFQHVRLLDGGLSKWQAEDREVAVGPGPALAAAEVTWYLQPDGALLAERRAVHNAVQTGEAVLVDMRSAEQYSGLSQSDKVERAGHIPGAVNVPAGDLLEGPHNTFKDPAALATLFAEAGARPDAPAIAYCNTGRDATTGYVALKLLDRKLLDRKLLDRPVRVYDGSMAEWSRQRSLQPTAGR